MNADLVPRQVAQARYAYFSLLQCASDRSIYVTLYDKYEDPCAVSEGIATCLSKGTLSEVSNLYITLTTSKIQSYHTPSEFLVHSSRLEELLVGASVSELGL